jgi:DeoR family fructose operon transcriptional repressor
LIIPIEGIWLFLAAFDVIIQFRRSDMLTEERHAFILNQLKQYHVVKTQTLMTALSSSESTIRRDLQQLEVDGKLKRIHGGAKRMYHLRDELSVNEKSSKKTHEKKMIGKLAASLINRNDVIYLDAGTTTLAMIEFINVRDIKIVTNGVLHASLLADKNIPTVLLGGNVKSSTKAVVGATSFRELSNYRFHKSFIGMNGIDQEFGCTTPDPEEAVLKEIAQQHAATAYVLADHSKWHQVHFVKVCEVDEVTILTDSVREDLISSIENTTILEAKQ